MKFIIIIIYLDKFYQEEQMKNLNRILKIIFALAILLSQFKVNANELNKNNDLEDGNYKIKVSLLKKEEEKLSMGNGALSEDAELEIKGDEKNLYIETKLMQFQNIKSSLNEFYYEDGEKFRRAKRGAFDILVEDENRPRIFKLELSSLKEISRVFLDPKVAVMGDEPIMARLKMDFENISKIKEDERSLADEFQNGNKEEKSSTFKKENMLVRINDEESDLVLSLKKTNNEKLKELEKTFDGEFLSYEFKFFKRIEEFEKDKIYDESKVYVNPKSGFDVEFKKDAINFLFEVFYEDGKKMDLKTVQTSLFTQI